MSRRGLRIAGVALLAVLLTGCIKLNVDLNVSSSNTVNGTMIFAFSKQLLALTGQSADQLLQSSAPLPSNVPGLSSKPYEDDQYAGEEFTFDSVPLERFNGSDPEGLRIQRQGDVFKVSGVIDLSNATGTSGATGPSGLGGALNQAMSTADIRITISFPGAVTQSNGDVSGNSVTWRPKIGQRLQLQATAQATGGGSSSSTIVLIAVVAAAVVAIVIVAIALARRRGGGPSAPGMGTTEMTPTAPMPPAQSSMGMPPAMPPAPPSEPAMPPEPPGGSTMPPEPPGRSTMPPEPPGGSTMPPEPPGGSTMPPEPPAETGPASGEAPPER